MNRNDLVSSFLVLSLPRFEPRAHFANSERFRERGLFRRKLPKAPPPNPGLMKMWKGAENRRPYTLAPRAPLGGEGLGEKGQEKRTTSCAEELTLETRWSP